MPLYVALRWLPATRAGAHRLGLVTRRAMIAALVQAIEAPPPSGIRIIEVPEIRRALSV